MADQLRVATQDDITELRNRIADLEKQVNASHARVARQEKWRNEMEQAGGIQARAGAPDVTRIVDGSGGAAVAPPASDPNYGVGATDVPTSSKTTRPGKPRVRDAAGDTGFANPGGNTSTTGVESYHVEGSQIPSPEFSTAPLASPSAQESLRNALANPDPGKPVSEEAAGSLEEPAPAKGKRSRPSKSKASKSK